MNKRRVLISYVQARKGIIGYLAICAVLFSAIFVLYDLPLEPLLYAILLCLSAGTLVIGKDLYSFFRLHRILAALKHSVTMELATLPQPQSLLEQDYQELLTLLLEDKRRSTLAAEQERRELMEYYTLWAHQVKTPIAAMRLLLQSKSDENSGELLAELFKIEQYADMVLQYLRVESPSTDFVLKRQSLDAIVRQAVHRYAKLFIRQKIRLEFEELNCEVLTDEKWLSFVIG